MSNSDSDLEEDEEEILVYVEFDNCATNDVFSSDNLKLDMLGLDSDHPVMQVNGKFFEGTYEDVVGTYLFFEKDNNPIIDDPVFDKIPTLKYYEKTRKLLKMRRAFVVPRHEVVGDSEHSKCIPNMETIKEAGIPPKYQEEALLFWKNSRNKRRDALSEYLQKQKFRKELRLRGFEPESESDEDNPFAMYKYLEKEEEINKCNENEKDNYELQIKNLENTLQMTGINNEETTKFPKKLTVIDPGPSTSKSSTPWIDEDTSEEQLLSQKIKSIGKIREKTIKGKVQKKTSRKKKLSISQKSLSDNSIDQSLDTTNINNDSLRLQNDQIIENTDAEQSNSNNVKYNDKIVNSKIIKAEQMEVDEIVAEESDKLLAEELKLSNSFIMDKNKRKQEKREAKMREISEKLRALSQSSSEPKS